MANKEQWKEQKKMSKLDGTFQVFSKDFYEFKGVLWGMLWVMILCLVA